MDLHNCARLQISPMASCVFSRELVVDNFICLWSVALQVCKILGVFFFLIFFNLNFACSASHDHPPSSPARSHNCLLVLCYYFHNITHPYPSCSNIMWLSFFSVLFLIKRIARFLLNFFLRANWLINVIIWVLESSLAIKFFLTFCDPRNWVNKSRRLKVFHFNSFSYCLSYYFFLLWPS